VPVRDFTSVGLYELSLLISEMRELTVSPSRVSSQIEKGPVEFLAQGLECRNLLGTCPGRQRGDVAMIVVSAQRSVNTCAVAGVRPFPSTTTRHTSCAPRNRQRREGLSAVTVPAPARTAAMRRRGPQCNRPASWPA